MKSKIVVRKALTIALLLSLPTAGLSNSLCAAAEQSSVQGNSVLSQDAIKALCVEAKLTDDQTTLVLANAQLTFEITEAQVAELIASQQPAASSSSVEANQNNTSSNGADVQDNTASDVKMTGSSSDVNAEELQLVSLESLQADPSWKSAVDRSGLTEAEFAEFCEQNAPSGAMQLGGRQYPVSPTFSTKLVDGAREYGPLSAAVVLAGLAGHYGYKLWSNHQLAKAQAAYLAVVEQVLHKVPTGSKAAYAKEVTLPEAPAILLEAQYKQLCDEYALALKAHNKATAVAKKANKLEPVKTAKLVYLEAQLARFEAEQTAYEAAVKAHAEALTKLKAGEKAPAAPVKPLILPRKSLVRKAGDVALLLTPGAIGAGTALTLGTNNRVSAALGNVATVAGNKVVAWTPACVSNALTASRDAVSGWASTGLSMVSSGATSAATWTKDAGKVIVTTAKENPKTTGVALAAAAVVGAAGCYGWKKLRAPKKNVEACTLQGACRRALVAQKQKPAEGTVVTLAQKTPETVITPAAPEAPVVVKTPVVSNKTTTFIQSLSNRMKAQGLRNKNLGANGSIAQGLKAELQQQGARGDVDAVVARLCMAPSGQADKATLLRLHAIVNRKKTEQQAQLYQECTDAITALVNPLFA